MQNHNVISIDLAKNVFQVCKMNEKNVVIFNRTYSRQRLLEFLAKEKPSIIAMESCGTSHYWCRYAITCGHEALAIPPRNVKAFRQGHKTDANDALAIAIAATQPAIQKSRVLSIEEQSLQSIERMREILRTQKVGISNQLRGLLSEFGIVIAKGDAALTKRIPEILEDAENELMMCFREALQAMWYTFHFVVEKLQSFRAQVEQLANQNETCIRLMDLEGIGPIGAVGLSIALGNGEHFKNGREASACIGVTPVQHSSGGKVILGKISRVTGNRKLRSTLIQGAMSAIRQIMNREPNTQKESWLKKLIERRGTKVAAVALANKNIRTALALIKTNSHYEPKVLAA